MASAEEDDWADQKGKFLAASYAGPVYELYGMKGLGTTEWPGVHQPIMNDVGYHIRTGLHFALSCPDQTVYDGKAIRRRLTVWLDAEEKHSFEALIDEGSASPWFSIHP